MKPETQHERPRTTLVETPSGGCLACGASPEFVGVWQPSSPVRALHGLPELVAYRLCSACADRGPEISESIEDRLISAFVGPAGDN